MILNHKLSLAIDATTPVSFVPTAARFFNPSGSTSYTFTGTAIGTATSTRQVIVLASFENSQGTFVQLTATLDATGTPVSMKRLAMHEPSTHGQTTALFQLAVPTGTTADITITSNLANALSNLGISVGVLDGVLDVAQDVAVPIAYSGVSSPFPSGSITVPTGGIGLGFAATMGFTGTPGWSNLTIDQTATQTNTFLATSIGHTTTPGAITPSATFTSGGGVVTMAAAWAPIPSSGSLAGITRTAFLNPGYNDFTQTNTATTALLDIGTAHANRRVIFALGMGNSYDGPVTSVTINGVNATLQQYIGTGSPFLGKIVFAWADVPTGSGYQNIVVTGGTASGNGNNIFAVYTVDKTTLIDSAPTFFKDEVSSSTSSTVSLNTGAGGFVIAIHRENYLDAAAAGGVTSSTEPMAVDCPWVGGNPMGPLVSRKSGVGANTPFSTTFGWTNNSQAISAIMYWR